MSIIPANKQSGAQSTSIKTLDQQYLAEKDSLDPLNAIDKQLADKAEAAVDSFFFSYHEK